jgi:hypothetical protein
VGLITKWLQAQVLLRAKSTSRRGRTELVRLDTCRVRSGPSTDSRRGKAKINPSAWL